MKDGIGGVKEYEAPTHLSEISELTHAVQITNNIADPQGM